MAIEYCVGDIIESGADIIVNIVNCMGKFESELCLRINEKWPMVRQEYCRVCDTYYDYPPDLLGVVQFVGIGNDRYVASCFGKLSPNDKDLAYEDFEKSLQHVLSFARSDNNSIAIQYETEFGQDSEKCEMMDAIITKVFKNYFGKVTIYKYEAA